MSSPVIPPCPDVQTNANILSRNQTTLTFNCPKDGQLIEGNQILTCISGTWDRPAPYCKDIGGLTQWDLAVVFGIVGGAAALVSIVIFIGLIYMACYKKDRRNSYKNDIMAMEVRNGGAPIDDDIYYPPSLANPGPAVINGGYIHDRSLPRSHVLSLTEHATAYDPETMTKHPVAWPYRVGDNSPKISIPRPVVGRAQIYSTGESSTDWEYGTQPTLTYAEAQRSRPRPYPM